MCIRDRSVPACELGWQGEGDVLVQGIIDLLFQEEDGWVLLDYKTNRVRAENEAALVAHYRRQLELYARAWSEIAGEKVKEKHLYFLRAGRSLALF